MIGIDTETIEGRAVLCCTSGGGVYWPHDARLLLDWLVTRGADCVAWNASYDARAVIAWLPVGVQELLAYVGRARWQGYRLRYIEGKLFEVSRGSGRRRARTRIYDACQFFGLSLRAAAEKYLSRKKLSQDVSPDGIARAMSTARGRARLVRYCVRDAELALELWERVAAGLAGVGVDPSHPVSPASLAARWAHHGWSETELREPREVARWGRAAYRGGRVEIWRRGYASRAWCTDISSAYPAELARLPHPAAIRWIRTCRARLDAVLGIYRCRIRVNPDLPAGPIPIRVDGVLVYPVGEWDCCIDRWTLELIEGAAGIDVEVQSGIEAHYTGLPRLAYPWIGDLYRLKETRRDLRLACKLTLNGLSGKLVQRDRGWRVVDDTWPLALPLASAGCSVIPYDRAGPYYRPVAAAHVTGAVRARVWRACMSAPQTVIAIATDAIWWSAPPSISLGTGLGGWTMAADDVPAYHLGCGVHACRPGTTDWHTTFRGFATRESLRDILLAAPPDATTLQVPVRLPGTLLWGVRSGRLNEIGTAIREYDLNGDRKRLWGEPVTVGDLRERLVESVPHTWYAEERR